MAYVIVEKTFDPPITVPEREKGSDRLHHCLEQNGVRWIRSYLSEDRGRQICEFEAADAEAVRIAHRTAGVSFVRAWTAELRVPEQEPHTLPDG